MFNKSKGSMISFNEIVFERRNKNYGAFQLRKEQDSNLLAGFFITSTALALIVGCIYITYLRQAPGVFETTFKDLNERVLEIINPETPEIPKDFPPKKNIMPLAGRKEINKDDLPPVPDTDAKKEEKKVEQKENPDTLAYNSQGQGDKGEILPSEGNESGSEKGVGSVSKPGITDFAEIMPEFPGGIEKMYSYLGKNLRYPQRLRTDRIGGTVFVAFVVNSEGKIGDIEILQTPDPGFNDEVIRVISKMPVWKPGLQSGQPVSVRFRMPVKFTIR